jgi:uncharacterized membrane protein YhfC
VRWRFFLYGALIFFVTQIIIRIPIVQVAQFMLGPALASSQTLLYAWIAVLSLTAGLFEEVGRYLGYRFLIKDERTWRVGLMYGAGHGGLESMLLVGGLVLLGLINVIALSTMDLSAVNLPPDQLAQVEAARQQIAGMDWWSPLLGAYERFITIFFQIALSIVVLQAFLRNSFLWVVIAIAIHAVVDFAALSAASTLGLVWTEVLLTLLLPLSFGIIYYFRPRTDDSLTPPPSVQEPQAA